MASTGVHIAAIYADLFASLNGLRKRELIEVLSKSLRETPETASSLDADAAFYASFGAFASDQTPGQIVADIKASRTFREKPLEF